MDSVGFLRTLRSTFPPADAQVIILSLKQEPLIWRYLQDKTNYDKVFSSIGNRFKEWNPAVIALIAMDLYTEADQFINKPLLPIDSELLKNAISFYEETLSSELPPENLNEAGILSLALRERVRIKGSWDGLAEEITASKPYPCTYLIWKAPLACAFSYVSEPGLFFKGLLPSDSTGIKDFFRLITHILFSNSLSDFDREEMLFKSISLRSPEEQITWLNLLENEGRTLFARKLGSRLLDGVTANSQNLDLDHFPSVDPLLDENIITKINRWHQLASYQRVTGNEELAFDSLEKAQESCKILNAQIKNHLAQLGGYIQNDEVLQTLKEVNELVPQSTLSQLQLANELISNNQSSEAKLYLPQIGDDLYATLTAARVACIQENIPELNAIIENISSWTPDDSSPKVNADYLNDLAQMFMNHGLIDQALVIIEKGSEIFPANPDLVNLAIQINSKLDRKSETESTAYLSVIMKPGDIISQKTMADVLERNEEWEEAFKERKLIVSSLENPSSSEFLHLAYCALMVKDQQTAISICHDILLNDPENSEACLYMGMAFLENNDYPSAITYLVQTTSLSPDNPLAWLNLANAYKQSENLEKALSTLQIASNLIPTSIDIQLTLAKLIINQGNISDALFYLKNAYSLDPQSVNSASLLSQALFNLGEFEEASSILERTLRTFPSDNNLLILYAQILVKLNNIIDAWKSFQLCIEIPDDNYDVLVAYCQAALYLLKQHLDTSNTPIGKDQPASLNIDIIKAISFARSAVAVRPASFEAMLLLAELLFADCQYEASLNQYIDLTKLPQSKETQWYWQILLGEGKSVLMLGDIDSALASLREAATAKPNEIEIQQSLTEAYLRANLPVEANDAAQTALFLAPEKHELLIWYSKVMDKLGQFPNAISALQKALQIYPENINTLLHLAKDEHQQGNKESAKEIIMNVIHNDQVTDRELEQTANFCLEIGSLNDAILCMEKIISKSPSPCIDHLISLAKIYQENGNLPSSMAILQRILEQQPCNPEIYLWKINLLIKQNNLTDALATTKAALLLPDITFETKKELNILAAHLYRKIGRLDFAENQLDDILIDAPEDLELNSLHSELTFSLMKGIGYQTDDQYQKWSNDIKEEKNNQKKALINLLYISAEAAIENANFEKAREMVAYLFTLAPDAPRTQADQSRLACAKNDLLHANEFLADAISSYASMSREMDFIEESNFESLKTFWIPLSIAEAAFDLKLWPKAIEFFKQASVLAPNELRPQVRYYRALVLGTELQHTYHQLRIIAHSLESEIFDETWYQKLNKKLISLPENPEVTRWLLRGQVVFEPTPQSAAVLANNIHDAGDAAAAISALLNINNFEQAQNILNNYPDDFDAQFATAVGMLKSNPQKSLAIASALVEKELCEPLCYALLAFSNADNYSESAHLIEIALSYWPDESRWHEFAAEAYHQMRNFELCIQHWDEAIRLEPNNPQFIFSIGNVYLETGEYKRAIQFFEKELHIDPQNQEAWRLLALAYRGIGEISSAFECVEKACSCANISLPSLLLLGQIALDLDRKEIALQKAQYILEIDPNNIEGIILYTRGLESSSSPLDALTFLEQTLPRIQAPFACLVEQARLIDCIYGHIRAMPYYADLFQNHPDETFVLTPYAKILAENGQLEEGENIAQKSLQIDSQQPDLHLLLGRFQRTKGQLDQAIFHLCEAIKQSPDMIEAYLELGQAYYDRRDHNMAIRTYRQATHVAPNDPRPYYHVGLILKESKDYIGSETMLRYAAKYSPNDLAIHRQLAAIIAINLVHNSQKVSI